MLTSYEKDGYYEQYKGTYFFHSHVFSDGAFDMEFVEFENIYRQKDSEFITLLNRIRNNSPETVDLEYLNRRCTPVDHENGMVITLATTNATAEKVNSERLISLPGGERIFSGNILGTVDEKQLPTEVELALKLGAQIMFVANDTRNRWVNGTIGKVIGYKKNLAGDECVEIETESEETVLVEPHTWEVYHFLPDAITGIV